MPNMVNTIFFKLFEISTIEYKNAINKQYTDTKITIKNSGLRTLICKMRIKYDLDMELTKSITLEETYIILKQMEKRYGEGFLQKFSDSLDNNLKSNKYVKYLYKSLEYVFFHMYNEHVQINKEHIYIRTQPISLDKFEPLVQELLIHKNTSKQQSIMNPFNLWFKENYKNILTKKQLNYLMDPNTEMLNSTSKWQFRRSIAKRTLNFYNKQFNNATLKEIELQKKIHLLNNIIGSYNNPKEFINKIAYYINHDFISNIVYSVNINTYVLKQIAVAISNKNYMPSQKTLEILYQALKAKLDELKDRINTPVKMAI